MVLNKPSDPFTDRNARRSSRGGFTEVFAKELEKTGYTITNTVFDLNNVIIYDVRGMYAFFIQLFNSSPDQILNYELFFATKDADDPTQIIEKDWFPLLTSTAIAADSWSNSTVDGAGNNISEFIRATPKITYFRIKLKMATSTPTLVTGVFSGV